MVSKVGDSLIIDLQLVFPSSSSQSDGKMVKLATWMGLVFLLRPRSHLNAAHYCSLQLCMKVIQDASQAVL